MEVVVMIVVLLIVAVVMKGIVEITKNAMQHTERMERLKRGYPIDDESPLEKTERNNNFSDGISSQQFHN